MKYSEEAEDDMIVIPYSSPYRMELRYLVSEIYIVALGPWKYLFNEIEEGHGIKITFSVKLSMEDRADVRKVKYN